MFRVLYVDDDPAVLEIGKLFLELDGQFQVDTITSAPAGLALIESVPYDAIISDYQMPGMDGIGFLKKVRGSGNTIPFILFTGRGREEVVIQALNEGADFYLQKGGDPQPQFTELSHKIRQAVQRGRAEKRIRDHERREAEILNFLPDATFAIDTSGVVIAWNRAMEQMTGVAASEMLGKGNYEYAIPFYNERRPILIDLVLKDDPATAARYPYVKRDANTLVSEISVPLLNGKKDVSLWFTASSLYGDTNTVVGAIESIRDITRRKQVLTALRESEARYRNVVEDQTEFICRFLPDGTHIFVNEAYCRYFRKPREEIIGKKFIPAIPGEEIHRVREHFASLTRENPTAIIEHRIFMPDGSVRWQRWSDRALFNEEGSLVEYQSVGRDVTEVKLAEEALRESAATLSSIFRAAPVGIGVVSDRILLSVNDRLCEMTGYTRADLVGKSARMLYPDDAEFDYVGREKYDQIRRHGTGSVETRWQFRDGSVHTILLSSTPLDPADPAAGVTFTALDITERTRSEKALRESEEKYRLIADNTADNIWIFDMDFRLQYISPSVKKIKGFTLEEALAQPLEAMLTPASLELVLRRFDEEMALEAAGTADPDRTVSFETEEYCKDGSVILVENTAVLLRDEHRRPVGVLGISRDITERKRMERALRESEDRYRKLVEILPDAVFLHQDGKIIYANPAAVRLVGAKNAEDLLAKKILGFVHPSSREKVLVSIAKDLSGELTPPLDLQMLRYDGTPVDVEGQGVSTLIDGSPAVMVAVRDITERKRAEEVLKESEEKYRIVAEMANDGIGIVQGTSVVYVNPSLANLVGYSVEEINGKSFLPFVPPESALDLLSLMKRKLLGEAVPNVLRTRVVHRDGHRIEVEANGTVIRWEGKKALYGIIRDITEQKKAEEVLKESEEKYRTLANNLPDYVLIHRNGKILYVNQACADITGISAEDLTGDSIFTFIAPESLPLVTEKMHLSRAGELKRMYEAAILVKNREKRYGIINSTTISYGGSPASLVVVSDITERKRAEDALRRANRQLTMMTGITRHDISNQIHVILTYLEMAKRKSGDPVMNELVQKLEPATLAIKSQIEFTKLYQDIGSREPQWLEPDRLLGLLPVPAHVTLTSDIRGVEVFADPLLEKVFFNLLDNSIRHGGRVTEIRVSSLRTDKELTLVWEDNGVGIPAGQKKKIFERGVGKNTGYGLFLVWEILSLTGITIRETGEPGKGARFEITVPKGEYRLRGSE